MIASNKTITRWICAYFNSWSVNFPVLAENFIDLFRDSSNKILYFISKVGFIRRNSEKSRQTYSFLLGSKN